VQESQVIRGWQEEARMEERLKTTREIVLRVPEVPFQTVVPLA
jgi:hypothetical protein